MATVREYSNGSIIYFEGDQAKEVYVLKEGNVVLSYPDVRTNEEIQEKVQLGEFFGIIASLARLTREETAKAIGKASVVVFPNLDEFSLYVMKNPRLITNMLQAFSERLRKVHKGLEVIVGHGSKLGENSSVQLFNLGKHYHQDSKYDYAIHIYLKCLENTSASLDKKRVEDLLLLAKSKKSI